MTGHSSALLKLCRAVYAKKSIRNLANIFELLDGSIFLHFHVSWTLLAWNHFPHHDRQWRKWRRSDVNFYMHIFINHARAVWVCTCGCATTRERERKNKYKWKAWCVEPGGLFGFSVLFCFVLFIFSFRFYTVGGDSPAVKSGMKLVGSLPPSSRTIKWNDESVWDSRIDA